MRVGDLVRYTIYHDSQWVEHGNVAVNDVRKEHLFGIVVRGGQHNALVLLNGRTEAGWISDEYLEVINESR